MAEPPKSKQPIQFSPLSYESTSVTVRMRNLTSLRRGRKALLRHTRDTLLLIPQQTLLPPSTTPHFSSCANFPYAVIGTGGSSKSERTDQTESDRENGKVVCVEHKRGFGSDTDMYPETDPFLLLHSYSVISSEKSVRTGICEGMRRCK